jgi:hypothetical protein
MEKQYTNLEHFKENPRISITPSGFFGSSEDNIQSRENFWSEKDRLRVLDFAKNIKYWDETVTKYNEDGTVTYESEYWKDRVATEYTIMEQDPEVPFIIRKYMEKLKVEVNNFFNVEAIPTSVTIVRWLPGQFQKPHADKELHEGPDAGKPNDFPYFDLAGLFYLNDDYEGGELYFPLQNIKFKPRAGAAYFFPGDKNYIHGVAKIISGTRYVVPFFWTILKHTGEKNNEQRN